jgi:hypothetical protein
VAHRKKIKDLFQRLEREAAEYPLEHVRLTDGGEWWQGLFLFDVQLSETRKNFLISTISRLSGHSVPSGENSLARKDSCQVSPEERAQLFSFLKQGGGAD